MKTISIALALVLMVCSAAVAQVVTFSIASSASTATPNLRIQFMTGPLQTAPGTQNPPMQAPVTDSVGNYYLTKTKTLNYSSPKQITWSLITVDQDTKAYIGSDLTNYILISAGTPYELILRK